MIYLMCKYILAWVCVVYYNIYIYIYIYTLLHRQCMYLYLFDIRRLMSPSFQSERQMLWYKNPLFWDTCHLEQCVLPRVTVTFDVIKHHRCVDPIKYLTVHSTADINCDLSAVFVLANFIAPLESNQRTRLVTSLDDESKGSVHRDWVYFLLIIGNNAVTCVDN